MILSYAAGTHRKTTVTLFSCFFADTLTSFIILFSLMGKCIKLTAVIL